MGRTFRARLLLAVILLFTAAAPAFDPWAGDFGKDNPDYVRVMSYNVLNLFPAGTEQEFEAHRRMLLATRPDVISYQEMDPGVAGQLATALSTIFGETWFTWEGQSDGFNVNIIASRWPMSMQRRDTEPTSSFRGVTMALIDLPNDRYATDLYFMAVHFPCCPEPDRIILRQRHADAVALWMGDARSQGGRITLPWGTPMMVVGDFNITNSRDPGARQTLIEGTISDTATFGPPVKGDWDGTNLGEALPLNPFTMSFNTHNSTGTSPGSWLDRFYYTDSRATVAQAFVLNTLTIPSDVLFTAGLQSTDTQIGSDHLPVFVDFAMPGIPVTEPLYADLFVTEFQPDPTFVSDVAGEWFEVFNRTDSPIDMNGWVLRDSGSNFHVIREQAGAVVSPRSHFVFALNNNPTANGNVPVDYVMNSGFRLANGADTIEIYRGSMKIDGVQYNNGAAGLAPENLAAGPVGAAIARAMQGNYFNGSTGIWGPAERFYNPQDRGTPGGFNENSQPVPPALWMIH